MLIWKCHSFAFVFYSYFCCIQNSRLTKDVLLFLFVCLFQHLKGVVPLYSDRFYVWWEISNISYPHSFVYNLLVSLWVLSKCSLSLLSSYMIVICRDMIFFVLILNNFRWTYWICVLTFFHLIREILVSISSVFLFSLPHFFLSFPIGTHLHIYYTTRCFCIRHQVFVHFSKSFFPFLLQFR